MKQSIKKPLVTICTYEERQTTAVNKSQGLNEGTGGIITTTTTANNNNINNNNNNNHDEVDNIKLNNNYIQLRNRIEYESSLSVVLNGSAGFRKSESDILSVPDTPIPDYDSTPSNTLTKVTNQNGLIVNKNEITKGTMGRVAASEIAKANGAAAEMESMESFKMTNPSSPIPKPPSVYFAPQSSGPATMKKSQRPVSVTIGEYGNLSDRRSAPAKFDFISRANVETKNEDVTTQLKNELEKTLSRSNLKKRTDIIDDKKLTNGNEKQTGIEMNKNTKTVLQKTQSGNFDKLSSILSQHHIKNNLNNNNNNSNNNSNNNNNNNNETTKVNRITISIPSKNESTSPNGILKTSITNIKTNTNGNAGEHKNIKFENI